MLGDVYKRQLHNVRNRSFVPSVLNRTDFVFIKTNAKGLKSPYIGPCRVIKRADKYFVVDVGGTRDTVTIDRLKPAFVDPEAIPYVAPKKGRPPRPPKSPTTGGGGVVPANEVRRNKQST